MRIIKAKDYKDMSRKAANIISAQIIMKPNCILGLATGATPEGTYEQLAQWYLQGDLDFSQVSSFNLDEYKGLSKDHNQSYNYYMNKNLFSKVNINPENTFLPNGMNEDSNEECSNYNEMIKASNGIDLQLLGLGHNGHIGFNEPEEAFESEVHCVDLSSQTIAANSRFFENTADIPKQAYTMGIKNIMQAKKILLIVSGQEKAEALWKSFQGPVTPLVPGSILQLHNDVTIIGDENALLKLEA
ncbi:MAG: glucosamine-6-phosphate deaminase [Ruminiclostridium sp.]